MHRQWVRSTKYKFWLDKPWKVLNAINRRLDQARRTSHATRKTQILPSKITGTASYSYFYLLHLPQQAKESKQGTLERSSREKRGLVSRPAARNLNPRLSLASLVLPLLDPCSKLSSRITRNHRKKVSSFTGCEPQSVLGQFWATFVCSSAQHQKQVN